MPEQVLEPQPDVAVDFLRALEPEGPWLVVAIKPKLTKEDRDAVAFGEFYPATEDKFREWLQQNHEKGWNQYFTSNLPRTPFKTSKEDQLEWLRLLHVDVDLPGAADNEELKTDLIARMNAMEPAPTAIVFTGGGCQAVWKFRERLPAQENIERVSTTNKTIATTLKGDHCHDVSHLLRLPGTINIPDFRKRARGRIPAATYLISANWIQTWSYQLDRVPRLPDSLIDADRRDSGEEARQESGVIDSLTPLLKKLIKSGDPKEFKNDRSRLGWYVMCNLLRARWTEEDITTLFLNPVFGVSAHYLDQSNPQQYVARNLARAKLAVAEDYQRHYRSGEILTESPFNIEKALDDLKVKLSYDVFADRTWVNGAGPLRVYSDADDRALWIKVREDLKFLPNRPVWDAVIMTRARRATYHPVRRYLDAQQPQWDGRERVGGLDARSWLTTYGEADDSPYTRAVGRLILVAAVRRVRQPGCKFDEMLLLINPAQGTNKSTAVRTLAVNEDWFNDYLPLGDVGREVIEHIRGFWIIEASELTGLRTRELEKIKSFCSRQHDRGRMSYDRIVSDVPRSCIFIGTTNSEALFTDHINRRFWPVKVGVFNVDALTRDLNQIWAEAATIESRGESIRLNPNLYPAATEEQDRYRVENPWAAAIDRKFGDLQGRVLSDDVWKIIGKPLGMRSSTDNRNLGDAMKELGFIRRQYRVGPSVKWFYVRGTLDGPQDLYVVYDPNSDDYITGTMADIGVHEEDKRLDEEIPF